MMETKIGTIRNVRFGWGGYQDAQIGISWSLGGQSWGVGDFWGHWGLERDANCKWTEEERISALGSTAMRIRDVLKDAKKSEISQLKGVPVEVTLEGSLLKSWRVLTEAVL